MCVSVCVCVLWGGFGGGGGGTGPLFVFQPQLHADFTFKKICPLFFIFPRFLIFFLGMVFIIMNYPAFIIIFIDNNSIIISDKT